jgi:hypothetical protein
MQTNTLPPPTLDDILRLFQETDRNFQEAEWFTSESREETEKEFKELALSTKAVTAIIDKLGDRLFEAMCCNMLYNDVCLERIQKEYNHATHTNQRSAFRFHQHPSQSQTARLDRPGCRSTRTQPI